jgi:nitrogen fixation-related uncharacterized protein
MICGLEQLKTISLEQFDDEENQQSAIYFDHLINCLTGFEDS